ncbi:S53 family peptidase [Kutzneria viridogrisea]|uniref:Subtilase family serine protease n=1 Tax=Kutzneria viridogrisea TaxID=47990 RepID=A0ABR6BGA7_9PSEU|nr:subtilase family serine protease [Kutzneria viridogrisea]
MRRTPAFLLAVAMAGAGVTSLATSASAAGMSAIPDSQPVWAKPNAKVAEVSGSDRLTFRVYLKAKDQAGLEAAATAVSDPSSPSYRRFLSTDEVRTRFAPSAGTVEAVRTWLSSSGFGIGEIPSNNQYVEATGSAAQVQHAFGVNLGLYKVKDRTLRSADRPLSVPAALAGAVSGVVNVDQALSLVKPSHVGANGDANADTVAQTKTAGPGVAPPPAGFVNAQPCSDYFGQKVDTTDPAYGGKQLPYAVCGYTPQQLRAASDLDNIGKVGLDGRGVTVAIVDAFASPTLYADAAEYAKRHDPAHPLTQGQYSQIVFPPTPGTEDPTQCDASGWYGEQSLDVEAVHAMAPGAKILYVGGADCTDLGLDKALNTIVAGNKAQIVSNSYGDTGEDIPADEVNAFQSIAIQAAAEGIGVYFSSGDNGDESHRLPKPSADFSASSQWVTAVGGTSLGIGKDGSKVLETGWSTGKSTLTNGAWGPAAPGTWLYGAGGGTSVLFPEPAYQKGVVPEALAKQNQTGDKRGRVVPDISMDADPTTGMLIGLTQTYPDGVHYGEYRIGGTSLASPLMAGLMAVADQFGGRHGFINPWMYKALSHTPAISDVKPVTGAGEVRVDYVNGFNDADGYVRTVRSFNNPDQTIQTTRGYDNVTGLGTPNGLLFLGLI